MTYKIQTKGRRNEWHHGDATDWPCYRVTNIELATLEGLKAGNTGAVTQGPKISKLPPADMKLYIMYPTASAQPSILLNVGSKPMKFTPTEEKPFALREILSIPPEDRVFWAIANQCIGETDA